MFSPHHQHPDSADKATTAVVNAPTHSRLRALLSLVDDNPSTMGPLLKAVRDSELLVATDSGIAESLAEAALICNHSAGCAYALSFLDRVKASEYMQCYEEHVEFVQCKGADLLLSLMHREVPLGLYIIDADQGYYFGPDLVMMGLSLTNFKEAETIPVQYSPTRYSATIPEDFITEVGIVCSQHPHIEKVYLCEVQGVKGRPEALLAILGDSEASDENVQDPLAVIAARMGILDWHNNVTWIEVGENEEYMIRYGIDCIYEKRLKK
jgi:hypothetical protein